jgi:hypothetical protein
MYVQIIGDRGDFFFQLVNRFQLFLCEKNPTVAGYGQNKKKMTYLQGGVDGFSYFSLIFS